MIILGTNSIKDTGGYQVANSLRFNSGSSDHLNRSTSSGNRLKWTWSAWIKKTKNGADEDLFSGYDDSSNYTQIQIGDTGRFNYINKTGGSQNGKIETNRVFRDNSAWYHFVIVWDSGNATAGNRMRIYVNGVEETSFATDTQPSENQVSTMNTASKANYIGSLQGTATFFNGYMAEVVLVDGQALTPTSFGEFDEDSGIWKPINVSGLTFGTNGFYLDFEDSSALGNDAAGSNNFTVNNLTALDESTDTCTNNFATGNPLQTNDLPTFSEGNLAFTSSSNHYKSGVSTIGVSSGKWFMESKFVSGTTHINGVIDEADLNAQSLTGSTAGVGFTTNSVGYLSGSGNRFIADGSASYGASYTTGDIIGIALDLDSGTKTVTFYKNGASQGAINLPTGGTGTFFFAPGIYNGVSNANFGSPSFAISSGNTDGDGYGNFEYAVPSGYFSLCTKNLAEYG